MKYRRTEGLRIMIANERSDERILVAALVAQLGHEIIEWEIESADVGTATVRERPDVVLVGPGESSEHALELIDRIVKDAACPVIALLHSPDPAFLKEASKRGVFAHVSDAAGEEDWQSSIDIVLRRFGEYKDLEGAFKRRALIEQTKGILMERHTIDEGGAFEMMRERARASNRKLVDVATGVVDGHLLLAKLPQPHSRSSSSPAKAAVDAPTVAETAARAATDRDRAAYSRDVTASARDQAAAWRDHALEVRDSALVGGEVNMTDAEIRVRATEQRRGAAADRITASESRSRAAADRGRAATDREEAARARTLAATDALTGARTRAAGLDDLDRELDRARRTTSGLVAAYVDVVGLKLVNDTQTHAAGDEMLRRVVREIRDRLRPYDLIARLGGDEFLCVMSGATIKDAIQRFAAIQAALAAQPDRSAIAVGYAVLAPGDSAAELVARADADLPTGGRRA
jgi:diguanylate cyclase (GGDEF)-like protein